jgi:hypothetical protein
MSISCKTAQTTTLLVSFSIQSFEFPAQKQKTKKKKKKIFAYKTERGDLTG